MTARRLISYLRLQLRRTREYLLPVLCISALLIGAVLIYGRAAVADHDNGEAQQRTAIGVVADMDDPVVRLSLYSIENMEISRFAVELVRPADEAEALRLLRTGRLSSYMVIPSGLSEAILRGEEPPKVRYISTEGAVGVGVLLERELVLAVERLLLEERSAVSGAQQFMAEYDPETDLYAFGDRVAEGFMALTISRDELVEREIVGVSGGMDIIRYYLCAMTVLFLLIWGVACGPLFFRRAPELGRMLRASGLGPAAQVLTEYAAYLLLQAGSFLLLMAAAGIAVENIPALQTLLGVGGGRVFAFALRAVVPALAFAALQLLLFELASDAVSALLLQFLAAMVLAYVSGCFYPAYFFPVGMQRLGAVLPSGFAIRWMNAPDGTAGLLLVLYAAAFLALLALCRRRTLEGGGR